MELETELASLGIWMDSLDGPPHDILFRPALRAIRSFVVPKTHQALAVARIQGRVSVVAGMVQRLLDEALIQRRAWHAAEQLAQGTDRSSLTVVLDNVRSTRNVGSLLQTCAAVGVTEMVVCGVTPHGPHPAVLRCAGSAAYQVRQRFVSDAATVVREFQRGGRSVWALETTSQALDYREAVAPCPLAIVLGHEKHGVSAEVLELCDAHVELPMQGIKNSLNVAVAGSIVMFDITRRWQSQQNSSAHARPTHR